MELLYMQLYEVPVAETTIRQLGEIGRLITGNLVGTHKALVDLVPAFLFCSGGANTSNALFHILLRQ